MNLANMKGLVVQLGIAESKSIVDFSGHTKTCHKISIPYLQMV
jgi:hypothetical protein